MADEMGVMILDESAIWLSDGGPKADSNLFWQNCRSHVEELVKRDRNHPSVFGWSVCNEILPVLRNVWHTPQSMIDHCLDEITVWKNICLTNDPTRTWISGDGEWDAEGRLPVINIHYGGDADLQRAQNPASLSPSAKRAWRNTAHRNRFPNSMVIAPMSPTLVAWKVWLTNATAY